MNEVFFLRQNHYNLRNFDVFAADNPRNKYLLNCLRSKHYPPKLRAVHHCSSLKIKSKLGAVIDVNVRYAQDILLVLVIFSLFFYDPKLIRGKIEPL